MAADIRSKILVIDDDQGSRELFKTLLSHFGYAVLEAHDGKEGLEQVRRHKPDLVISDILMPSMNGFQFVSALREFAGPEDLPVIFHSASFLDRETRALGAACGVAHFILKPCDPEKALAVIREALGHEPDVAPAFAALSAPFAEATSAAAADAIPFLIDAFFKKGLELDSVSLRLASLLALAMEISGSLDIGRLIQVSCDGARKVIGANYAAIGFLEGEGCRLRSYTLSGASPEAAAELAGAFFSGRIFQRLVQDRKVCREFSLYKEPEGLDLPPGHPPVRSFLGAPLVAAGRVYGWMYAAEKLGSLEFSDEDAQVLAALAGFAALAYESALRLRTIEEHSAQLESEIEERNRAEERFRILVETSPAGIIIADESGRISDLNAQIERMFGYAREELLGQTVDVLLPERLREMHEKHRFGYARDPRVRPMGLGLELFARRKDGSEFPVEVSLGPLAMHGETLVSATIVDITARKKMEEQMRLSQRMEAIGKLAGGVAHDFNNMLAVILGCCDFVAEAIPREQAAAKKVDLIKQAAASAADLTRQLLAFSRQQILQPRVLDLAEIVRRVEGLLARLIGENIRLSVSTEEPLGQIKADPGQIEQVLVNLAANARDAMPQGGSLNIEARNADLDESYSREHQQVVPGPYVMLSVEDTGCGMDQKTQARIFDPFFTTKELGKGTGLGLATVYGIVKQSGGYIWVYSELGHGTVFKVYLPRVDQAASVNKPSPAELKAPEGCETILIAEDSESLREIAGEYLESLGYTVLIGESGKEALQRAEEFGRPIHLLLTDVVMPEMSGPQLAAQMSARFPGLKIIYTSGYTDDIVARQGILDPGVAFIQKPYRPKALARKIREILNERSPNQEAPLEEPSQVRG